MKGASVKEIVWRQCRQNGLTRIAIQCIHADHSLSSKLVKTQTDKERGRHSQKLILRYRTVIFNRSREPVYSQVSEDTNIWTFMFIDVQESLWVKLICICAPNLRKTVVVSAATRLIHRCLTDCTQQ